MHILAITTRTDFIRELALKCSVLDHEYMIATSVDEGLTLFWRYPPDVVILELPTATGAVAARRFAPLLKRVTVIVAYNLRQWRQALNVALTLTTTAPPPHEHHPHEPRL